MEPVLYLLGTVSTMPNYFRDISAYLINVGDVSLLLDCGEGIIS